ncbi:MAG: thioesterase family protein [Gemmatimonadaceae bacterium]|nr:thioesterase family protein [Gemmatimonadaceae bacterium]
MATLYRADAAFTNAARARRLLLAVQFDSHGVIAMGQETVSDIRVRYAETDQMGVVYHANYLVWCEIGRTDFIRRCGMSYADMERAGTKLAVTEATLRLHASARYDDEVRVTTRVAALRSRAVEFAYDITRADDGTRIASATTTLVSLSPEGRPVTLTPDIRALLQRGPLVT